MEIISTHLRQVYSYLNSHWEERINKDFGIKIIKESPEDCGPYNTDPVILRQIYLILNKIPRNLIKDCGINKLGLKDLGENKPYYPNHGYYDGSKIILNSDIFYNPDIPDDFYDHRGYFVSRPEQTLIHELGHSYDACQEYLSLKDDWLSLSGWSKDSKSGLKRLIINDKDAPPIQGEWFFDPKSGFTRFYAKRNPEDDFADSFAFFILNLKNKIPENKRMYLNKLLFKYYS